MSETETASPVRPGDVVAGKYRVENVLGVGGMGVVVAATHLELGQRVAVKFLLPELAANPEGAVRFSREARASVQLTSEHAVRVHDVGQMENGAPYMVMEFLEGADLGDVLQKSGPFDVARTVQYMLQALDALAEAHAAGIIHRDLKPSNLFLARRGRAQRIKVLDFGISKQLVESQGSFALTGTSAILGSPYYMAPEQMRSTRTVDQRADIWSLGVIMYELCTGRLPFQANTLTELCLMIAQDTPAPVRTFRGDLPAAFESIIHRCLAKDPADRFGNVTELAEQLEALGASLGLSTGGISSGPISVRDPVSAGAPALPPPSSPAIGPGSSPHMHTAASMTFGKSGEALPIRRPPSRTMLVLLAGALALALVGAALIVRSGGPKDHAASSSPARPPVAREAPPPPRPTETAALSAPTAPAPTEAPSAVASAVEAPSGSVSPASRSRANAGSRPAPTPRAPSSAPAKTPAPPASNSSTFSHDRQ